MYRPAPILSNLFVILITCCNCSSQSLSSTQSFKGDVDHMLFNPPAHGYVSNLPATKWEESMITGNGTFGALVLGYPLKERIILSHEKLFMPENPPTPAPDLGGNLSTIRELVLSGKGDKASELSLQVGKDVGINGMIWTDPLIPACQIELEGLDQEAVLNYSRSVNYETGEASTAWTTEKGVFHRTVFASRKDGVIAVKFSSQEGTLSSFRIRLSQLPVNNGETNDEEQVFDTGDLIDKVTASVYEDGHMKYTTLFRKKWEGSLKGYTVETHVSQCDGEMRTDGEWLYLEGCSDVLLLSGISLSHDLPVSTETGVLQAAGMDYEELLERHSAIHGEMFRRFSFSLGEDDEVYQTPDLLLESSSNGSLNNQLVEELCEAARYILISSTGELPPTLQGIWGGTWRPAWSGDFTQNGNVPSAIASGLNTNFQEVTEAHMNYMFSMFDDFRDNARDMYGAPGIFVPSRSSSSGKTYHYGEYHPHLFWYAGGAWTSQFFYDYWQYTGDDQFLKERAIPFMLASAEFLEFIITEGENGQLMFLPSYSPEVGPVGKHPLSINSTMDIAATKQLLRNLLHLADLGYLETSKTDQWKQIISRLPDYAIDETGDLKEWIWPGLKNNNSHRHASHLYPLFYEVDPDFEESAELRAAAVKAIENRLKYRREKNGAEMAFGLVQIGLAASHIGDTEHAYECVDWLCNSYWSPAFTSYHDPGEIFNVDICGGLPALVTEMIIQSSAGDVILLPALPDQWPEGEIKGVLTRCGVTIDLSWKEGLPVSAILKARRNTSFDLVFHGQTWGFSLSEGQQQTWNMFSCSNSPSGTQGSASDFTGSPDYGLMKIPSPADVHLVQGGRFESRYKGNTEYLKYQHEHYGTFMLDAFASRNYSPGKLLERMWDGEYAGKWIDAATRTAVNTGDEELLVMLDTFIEKLLKYQQDDGYLGIKLPNDRKLNAWEKEWDNWNLWNALNGLLTHYELCGAERSLEAASAIGMWIVKTYGPLTRSSDLFLKGEIIDAFTNVVVTAQLVRLYRHTGNPDFLEFVRQTIEFYPPIQQMLSTGEPYLVHPYMLSAVLGGLLAYAQETGDQNIIQTVEQIWTSLSENHLYPTGSLGERENLDDDPIQDVPDGQLQETCATTEWIFLNTSLYEITGRERYVAALELTCYNALLAAQSQDGLKWCYWTPLRYSKHWFHGPTRCCYWSGPRGISRLPQFIYATRENIVYINMFESSRASLSAGGESIEILQNSEFPAKGRSELIVKASAGWNGRLRTRVPEWTSEYTVSIDGQEVAGKSEIEGYMDFNLQGSEEYLVIIEFDIPLILEPLAEAGYVIRRGPEVLSIDMRDNIDTWLGQDDLISLPPGITFKETESFKPYSWPGPADKEHNRRRYRVEVADERSDELRSVILTPYADAGNDGAAFRTLFPLAE